jgi:hypothetical protein
MTAMVKVFQRGSWSRQSPTFRRDPHQKTFTKASIRADRSEWLL